MILPRCPLSPYRGEVRFLHFVRFVPGPFMTIHRNALLLKSRIGVFIVFFYQFWHLPEMKRQCYKRSAVAGSGNGLIDTQIVYAWPETVVVWGISRSSKIKLCCMVCFYRNREPVIPVCVPGKIDGFTPERQYQYCPTSLHNLRKAEHSSENH